MLSIKQARRMVRKARQRYSRAERALHAIRTRDSKGRPIPLGMRGLTAFKNLEQAQREFERRTVLLDTLLRLSPEPIWFTGLTYVRQGRGVSDAAMERKGYVRSHYEKIRVSV